MQTAGQDGEDGDESVIDLRERAEPSSRWSSLGDQRWLATNARASAAPDTAGTTETGLPETTAGREPVPSAAQPPAPARTAAGSAGQGGSPAFGGS